jgi:hypothetical protein
LEILQLAAANATSESELDEIAGSLGLLPGGDANSAVVVPGSAAAINAARSRILSDNNDRAISRRNNALFEQAQGELAEAELDNQFQQDNGDLLTQLTRAAQRGQDTAALEDQLAERATGTYGADRVNAAIRRALEDSDRGQKSRFTRANNADTLEANADADRQRDFNFQRNVVTAGRNDKAFASSEKIRDAVAYAQTQLPTRRSQEEYLKNTAGLDNEEYVTALQALDAGPGLDTTQPIRDQLGLNAPAPNGPPSAFEQGRRALVTALGGEVRTTPQDVPISGTIAGAEGLIQSAIATDPNLQVIDRAQGLEEELSGFTGNLGVFLQEKFPDYDFSKGEEQLIDNTRKRLGLTLAETAAIAMDNIKVPGGIGGIGNSPELNNDAFRRAAENFKNERPAALAEYQRVQQDRLGLGTTQAQIMARQRDLARIRESSNANPEEVARIEEEISVLTNRLLATERRYAQRAGNSGR